MIFIMITKRINKISAASADQCPASPQAAAAALTKSQSCFTVQPGFV